MYSWQFSKNFPLPKNGGPFEFLPKMAKHKFASISLTVRDRVISSKFSTHRVSKQCTLQFSKNFPLPKNGGHFEFSNFCQWQNTKFSKNFPLPKNEFLPKMAKHKFASISLTMRDRVISSKFSTHRVSKQCTLCNFQKIFPSPKMAAILNFRIFAKNGKTQNCFYLLNRANRSISSKFSTHTVSKKCTLGNFQKFSPPQKWRPF